MQLYIHSVTKTWAATPERVLLIEISLKAYMNNSATFFDCPPAFKFVLFNEIHISRID